MNNFEYENNHATDVDFVIVEPDFKSGAEKEVKTSPPFTDEPKEKKKKANAKIAIIVALFLVSNTFAGALGGIAALKWAAPSYNSLGTGSASSVKAVTTSSKQTANSANALSTTEIVNMNENSIVEIKTEGIATDSWLTQYITQGAGSGVIISSDGYIVTNNHVIENSNKISVTTKNGKSYTASLVGADDETDLAVLKINAKNLQPVIFGDSSTTSVGDTAIAIGNPLGNLGGTVTQGIISALDRQITLEGKTMQLIQTDAAVNPGNSGGGMFNDKGELIGVVVAKSGGTNVEGIGFAIPVDKVKSVTKQIVQYGYVRGRASTGMTYVDLTSVKDALVYGATNLGIYVQSVDSDLAKKAGFKAGDMIFYVGNKQIKSFDDLTQSLSGKKVGETIDVRVVRDDKILKLHLTLGEKTS
jgi:putative serine protease htrA